MSTPPPNALEKCTKLGYANHVFISWPHNIEQQGRKIVEQLAEALPDRFSTDGDAEIFLDAARTKRTPGYRWNDDLRVNLCRSAVTIVIIVRRFFLSDYCKIEWSITEQLQARRLSDTDATCFIPIVLSAEPVPKEVADLQCIDAFLPILTHGKNPRAHPKWRKLVADLANQIVKRLQLLENHQPHWAEDEALAKRAKPKAFTWQAPDPGASGPAGAGGDPPDAGGPSLPRFVVEKKI